MTEFVVILPVLLLILFGLIQFGIIYNHYLTITDAVRVGARQAAVARLAADPVGKAVTAVRGASPALDQAQLTVDVTPPPWQQGGDVTVSAAYPYEVSLLGLVVQSGQLTSSTTERVE